MKNRNRPGFTLIELLVVIAIIAILAAILFPVFASAKVAAKKTRVISDAKQLALGHLMYCSDNDDYFSPIGGFTGGWNCPSWQTLILPYIKNAGIFLDPFTPNLGATDPMILNARWAMLPRRAASLYCPSDPNDLSGCAMGVYNPNSRAQITGGEAWGRDGIAGVYVDKTQWQVFWADAYKDTYPSLSQTAVSRVSDTMLITQAATFDLQWAQDWNPDEAFREFGMGVFNLYGDQNVTTGPHARVAANGQEAGIYPTNISEPSVFPKGINVAAYCDGHAKASSWSSLHSQTVTNGTVKYLKYASPELG